VLGVERLVPFEDVVDASGDSIVLRASWADFANMPPFDRTVEYMPPGTGDTYVDEIRTTHENRDRPGTHCKAGAEEPFAVLLHRKRY
jgi:hypothetical protein